MIRLYNSLSRKEEALPSHKLRIYMCGITVSGPCHIGHARALINLDFILRYFTFKDIEFTYVRNITDIDDKIIAACTEKQISLNVFTANLITEMHEDFQALNLLSPDIEPKATEHIPTMIDMISELIRKEYAYVAQDGVYFVCNKLDNYGQLSRRTTTDNFVLWKLTDQESFPSPWGKGRPGWHIECSAMCQKIFDGYCDIHAGGIDLMFPHHENELAQSYACNGHLLSPFWLHFANLDVEGIKMSKSFNNYVSIKDCLHTYGSNAFRLLVMKSHYSQPLNFTDLEINNAKKHWEEIISYLSAIPIQSNLQHAQELSLFEQYMNNNVQTSQIYAQIHVLLRELKETIEWDLRIVKGNILRNILHILGFIMPNPVEKQIAESINEEIKKRNVLRSQSLYYLADKIKEKLIEQGIFLEDKSNGNTIWRIKNGYRAQSKK